MATTRQQFGYGRHGSISTEDGVIETSDAEIAAQLEANQGLTRIG